MIMLILKSFFLYFFFFSSRRRHTRSLCDWSSGRVLFRSSRKSRKWPSASLIPILRGWGGASAGSFLPWSSSRNPGGTRQVMLTWKFDCSGVCLYRYARSEERRVGKECRCGWSTDVEKNKE